MQCCGGKTNPFFTINPFQKDCCANGTTAPKGKCPNIEPTIYPETTQTTDGYDEATTGIVRKFNYWITSGPAFGCSFDGKNNF